MASDMFVQSANVVAREVGGETVLLDLEKGTYFGLNAVGGRIWAFLDDAPRTSEQIVAMLVNEYEVSREEADADVRALAADLLANGLLEQVASQP